MTSQISAFLLNVQPALGRTLPTREYSLPHDDANVHPMRSNAIIDLQETNVFDAQVVFRNGYDFSDGVGTISEQLLRRVWRVYGARRLVKPTAL